MPLSRRLVVVSLRSAGTATRLLLAGALVLMGVAGAAFAVSQAAKPGVTLQISPASQSITRGQSASYIVSVSSTNGFTGTVSLSAAGVPGGATAGLTPASVTVTAGGSTSTATSTLKVTTTSTTSAGSSTLTVTGAGGKVSDSVTAGLTVNYPLSSTISMNVTPASITMAAGSSATYAVELTRTNLPGPVTFAAYGGLPSGATATFTPSSTTGNSATLQLSTTAATVKGTYTLYLVASGPDPGGTTRYAYAMTELVIATSSGSSSPFTISGSVSGLAPGVSVPLNLTLSNPNKKALAVTGLGVTIQGVTRTSDATAHNLPCGPTDYAVTQYGGPYPLTVPAKGSASLSGLGVPSSAWPRVTMLDRPTNQDGCKGASLTLAYSGSGEGDR
jgi:hypothetical protein